MLLQPRNIHTKHVPHPPALSDARKFANFVPHTRGKSDIFERKLLVELNSTYITVHIEHAPAALCNRSHALRSSTSTRVSALLLLWPCRSHSRSASSAVSVCFQPPFAQAKPDPSHAQITHRRARVCVYRKKSAPRYRVRRVRLQQPKTANRIHNI